MRNPIPVSSNAVHDAMYSIQKCVIKFVSELWQAGGFYPGTTVSSTNITDSHDITESGAKHHNPNTNNTYSTLYCREIKMLFRLQLNFCVCL